MFHPQLETFIHVVVTFDDRPAEFSQLEERLGTDIDCFVSPCDSSAWKKNLPFINWAAVAAASACPKDIVSPASQSYAGRISKMKRSCLSGAVFPLSLTGCAMKLCICSPIEVMRKKILMWEQMRNNQIKKINWQFTSEGARIKLRKLYPKI